VALPAAVEDAVMRSLSKRAQDRFDTAREMRKVLEGVMRDNDIALVETQKLGRDLLGDLHKPSTPAPQRIATAADLADELEPSSTRLPRKRRSWLPWLVLGVIAVAGAGTGWVLVMRNRDHGPPPGPFGAISLDPPRTVGALTIVSDGSIKAEDVARGYREELVALQDRVNAALAKQVKTPIQLPDRIHDIYALPQSALCMKSAYVDRLEPPADCEVLPFVITIDRDQRPKLYVVSARLAEGMRGGVAEATCMFQPDESELSRRICKLAKGEK
jgi:hypothetical protein